MKIICLFIPFHFSILHGNDCSLQNKNNICYGKELFDLALYGNISNINLKEKKSLILTRN